MKLNTPLLLLVVVLLALPGCTKAAGETIPGVAFFFPLESMSGRDMLTADLDALEYAEQPLIAADEIISYDAETFDLKLEQAAVERLEALQVPVQGLGFAIFVDGQPLFPGAVWVAYSSLSFDGLTINLPLFNDDNIVHLYSGYPSVDALVPGDTRADPRLLDAFEQAGKLR